MVVESRLLEGKRVIQPSYCPKMRVKTSSLNVSYVLSKDIQGIEVMKAANRDQLGIKDLVVSLDAIRIAMTINHQLHDVDPCKGRALDEENFT